MSAVGVVAILTVAEGKNAEFEATFGELVAAVRADEPGNEFYSIFRSADDPQQYKVLERYVDQKAYEAHRATEHFGRISAKLGPLMAAAPAIERMEAV